MKYVTYIIILVLFAGCSLSSRLERKQSRAIAEYKPTQQEPEKTHRTSYYGIKKDSTTYYIIPTTKDENGEDIMNMQIDEVVVVAKSRTIPERNGKVYIDFVITLPKELHGNCQSVSVVPYLHKQDGNIPLQELSIRGGLFSKVQDRNYWQFNQYVKVFRPDATAEQRAYERFVKYPYPHGTRLDSIVDSKEKISYYYTQELNTAGEGKKMLITLHGSVKGLDGSNYNLPPIDTLEYNISSMLTFVDTTKRYVTKVIEKYSVITNKNLLKFKVNDARIIDTLSDNHTQLSNIEELMGQVINQQEFYIDSIILTASASPEGRFEHNNALAKARAFSLKEHLTERFGRGVDSMIKVNWIAEDWDELQQLIKGDNNLKDKDGLLSIINSIGNPDRRETALKNRKEYKYIKETLYPRLRSVSFKYNLRRIGMVKDTIHTTEPDALYAKGVELLNERRYNEAAVILVEYADQNTAVCFLSLGKDSEAYRILLTLPETAFVNYLRAIACSRLDMIEQGRDWFLKACNLNETLQYRGKLDPEINRLLMINE